MELKGKRLILASNSPRRRELLAGLNIEFENKDIVTTKLLRY